MKAHAQGAGARRRYSIIVCSLVITATAFALGATHATGFPDFSFPYSGAAGNCSDEIDPIGVFFEGDEANAVHVAQQVEAHAEWFDTSGSNQGARTRAGASSYPCRDLDTQRANGGATSTRLHVRLWRAPYYTGVYRKVVGTPHHEDWVIGPNCFGNHAVDSNGPNGSGFDRGRQHLRDEFQGEGHATDGRNFGNTRNFQQCDGDFAGSNGGGVRIAMFH